MAAARVAGRGQVKIDADRLADVRGVNGNQISEIALMGPIRPLGVGCTQATPPPYRDPQLP